MEDDQLFAAEKPARRPPWNNDRLIGASSKQGTDRSTAASYHQRPPRLANRRFSRRNKSMR
jgi:hypothetical protein